MIRCLLIIFVGFLIVTLAMAQQKETPVSQASDTSESFFNEFFSHPKNPFASPFKPVTTIKKPLRIPVVVRQMAPTPKPPPPIDVKTLGLKLNGVVWDTGRPQAIINDQVVEVGDTIGEAKVIAIGEQGVGLQYKGQKLTLKREGI